MLGFLMTLVQLLVGSACVAMVAVGFSIAADKLTDLYRGEQR
tara:strand:- start:1893 stop:2018 length:126 start_codon:yes stop_codon:yes gene_type:complete